MAGSAPTLGGYTLANPYVYECPLEYRGGRRIMADGSLVTALVAPGGKHTFRLEWRLLTGAQLATIKTAFAAIDDSSGTFVDPNGDSYTVTQDDGDPMLATEMVNLPAGIRWNVGMRLREV